MHTWLCVMHPDVKGLGTHARARPPRAPPPAPSPASGRGEGSRVGLWDVTQLLRPFQPLVDGDLLGLQMTGMSR